MSIDFSKPINTDAADGVLAQIRENVNSILTHTHGSGTNVPTNAIRINPTTSIIEIFNGTIWTRHGPILTHFASSNSAGSANAQTATFSPAPSALGDGQVFIMVAGFANTGSMTLNPNGLGAITVYDAKTNAALVGGEIFQYMRCQFLYSGGNLYLLNGVQGQAVTWSPTVTGFSVNPTNPVFTYMKNGRLCTLFISGGAAGTSNATTYTYSLPFTAATRPNMEWKATLAQGYNNGGYLTVPGLMKIVSGGTVVNLYTTQGEGAWTAGLTAKVASGSITYETAS